MAYNSFILVGRSFLFIKQREKKDNKDLQQYRHYISQVLTYDVSKTDRPEIIKDTKQSSLNQ